PGFTLSRGYQYRADYPVVAIHTYRTWKDPQGFVNQIAEFKGPTTIQRATGPSGIPARTTVFSTISWVHRIQTASGWEQISSDGTRTTASASSAGTSSYCNTAAAGVNLAVTAPCTAAYTGGAAVDGTLAGVTAGVILYLVVPGTKTADSVL